MSQNVRFPTLIAIMGLAITMAGPVLADPDEPDCIRAYERAAEPYWRIASDMQTFRAMFDDYDRLCTRHFPEAMESLQPRADRLRAQVKDDMARTPDVVRYLFSNILPRDVGKACAGDEAARATVEKNFLNTLKTQSGHIDKRLKRSAANVKNPEESLKLCRDLGTYAPRIEKALGPDLSNPLLEMTALHAQATRTGSRHHKSALKHWRSALQSLDHKQ